MLGALDQILFGHPLMIVLTFALSLYILIKSSDVLTHYAEKVGLLMGIPQFVVGLTIVSVGTSLPEIATSLYAVFRGDTSIVAANVVGSNIANLLLVIGLVAVIVHHLKVEWDLIKIDLPLLVGSAFILSFLLWDGVFTLWEGLFSLVAYIVYVRYSLSHRHEDHKSPKVKFTWHIPVFIILSTIFISLSADYTIQSILAFVDLPLMQQLGINTSIIAISAVAIGTSLPEVSVSIAAARRKNYEVALGNVIGSNIFNSFVVMAIPAFITPLAVTTTVITLAIPFMIAATLIYTFVTQDREVSTHEGMLFLLVYILFIAKLFSLF